MSTHFSFTDEEPTDPEQLPKALTFDVTYKDGTVESFACVPLWPAGAAFGLGRSLTADNLHQLELIGKFFDAVLDADSRVRFEAAINRPLNGIKMPTAIAVYHKLIAEYTGRPTGGSSDSSDGPDTDGPSSTDGPPAPTEAGTH